MWNVHDLEMSQLIGVVASAKVENRVFGGGSGPTVIEERFKRNHCDSVHGIARVHCGQVV